MTAEITPMRWAFRITDILNKVLGANHFPIDVRTVALDLSRSLFPNDPITDVKGDDLPGFEGALYPAKAGRKGWGIIYNNRISSPGRINFTLAHELGHYLLHRLQFPNGKECSQQDVARWDSPEGKIEQQANEFAANLLMPLDDFRRQIPEKATVDLDMLSECASRYRVSLTATALRWLGYTGKRAVLVVSVDGYILWARSSTPALKSGAYFKTSLGPIEVPSAAAPVCRDLLADGRASIQHGPNVWLTEAVLEHTLVPDRHDFAASLLVLDDTPPYRDFDGDGEVDTYEKMTAKRRREW